MDKNGPEIKIDNGELATSMIPEDFTEPQVLYEKLIKMIRQYHPSDDISMIEKAYRIAYKAHDGQLRKSGEPYIIHPVCVCIILAELELDKETIVAGMLHDVVEDTVMTSEERPAAKRPGGISQIPYIFHNKTPRAADCRPYDKPFWDPTIP